MYISHISHRRLTRKLLNYVSQTVYITHNTQFSYEFSICFITQHAIWYIQYLQLILHFSQPFTYLYLSRSCIDTVL